MTPQEQRRAADALAKREARKRDRALGVTEVCLRVPQHMADEFKLYAIQAVDAYMATRKPKEADQ